ncbi:MAG: rod shape-determining protein MreD [Thermoanaerobaculia bacterium]
MKPLRVAIGLSLAVLATLALGALHVPAPPDFFLLVVADMAKGGAAVPAMLVGLPAGLLEDTLFAPGRLLGLHAFSKILIAYLLATLGARTVVEKPVAVGGLLAGAVLVEAAALTFLVWVLKGDFLPPAPWRLLARAVTTGLFGGLLYAASRVPWKQRREARRRVRLN